MQNTDGVDREGCLLIQPGLYEAMKRLTQELEGDFFKYGLKQCVHCDHNVPKEQAIQIHCELRTVYQTLEAMLEQIEGLESKIKERRNA